MYESYKYLRPIAIVAGVLGILQSLTWIAMAITGLVAYYCHMDFSGMVASMGSVTELTFFHLYFHGDCIQPDLPFIDFTPLQHLNLMTPVDVHAWMWIYMILSFFWLISSITLITNVRYRYLPYVNIFLYVWIGIVLVISVIDLALGIVFGLDYEAIMHEAHTILLDPSGIIPLNVGTEFVLLSGQAAAGIMMAVSFRGYLLWVINVILCVYFFTQTFKIYDYNKIKAMGNINPAYDPHPIDAYGNKNNTNLWHTSSGPQANGYQTRSNPAPKSTAAASLYDERKRHYEAQQNHLRARENEVQLRREDAAADVVRELNHRNSFNTNSRVPEPDYSPPMPRTNPYDSRPPLRSVLRGSRYQ